MPPVQSSESGGPGEALPLGHGGLPSMSRLALATWTLTSIGAVAAAVGLGVVPALGRGASDDDAARRAKLFESADCRHSPESDTRIGNGSPTPVLTTGLTQTISVRVPRTTLLRMDTAGHITAAATNTGCAPTAGDDVFRFRPDGTLEKTDAIDVEDYRWSGDFTVPGRFQTQQLRG